MTALSDTARSPVETIRRIRAILPRYADLVTRLETIDTDEQVELFTAEDELCALLVTAEDAGTLAEIESFLSTVYGG